MSVTRAHVKRSDEWVAKSRDECGALWEKDEMTTAVFFGFFQADAAEREHERRKRETKQKQKDNNNTKKKRKQNKTKQTDRNIST